MRLLVLLILSLTAGPVLAQIYKCETDSGTVYGDTPCGEALPLPELPKKAKAPQGLRSGEKQRLRSVEAREAGVLKAEERQEKLRRAEERAEQRKAAQDEKRCRAAQRKLARTEEELRKGYKPSREVTLQRNLREYREDAGLYCG
jgi:hypothetical protein